MNLIHEGRSELIERQLSITQGKRVIVDAEQTMNKVTESFLSATLLTLTAEYEVLLPIFKQV